MRIVIDFPELPGDVEYRLNANNIFQVIQLASLANTVQANAQGAVKLNPPNENEVTAYAHSIGYDIDAEAFIAHYDSVGWQRAEGQPYKAWRPLVIKWRKNRGKFESPTYTKVAKKGVTNALMDWAKQEDEKRNSGKT